MHVVNTWADLDEKVESSVLAQVLFFSDQIEQVALWGILQGEVDGFFIFEACVKSANVLVVQLFLNTNFSD
jgi:hypothetical protein